MILWLHNQGYTYFSIPRLTYPEIRGLVDARDRQVKKEKLENHLKNGTKKNYIQIMVKKCQKSI